MKNKVIVLRIYENSLEINRILLIRKLIEYIGY